MVAVDSPDQDISRSHVEIRAEGEHVLVTDLDTTNGTVLLRGGSEPVRLHPNEPTMVVTGDVLDLGDDVTVTFETSRERRQASAGTAARPARIHLRRRARLGWVRGRLSL